MSFTNVQRKIDKLKKEQMQTFSVIIPCYNASSVIRRALEALENQTYKDFEVIVIDDCSTDDSREVVKSCIEEMSISIRLLENEKNSGPGFSRNRGIKEAQGKYLCFLDSDDYFDTTYFDCLFRQLEKTDSDVVFFGICQVIGDKCRELSALNYSKEEYLALSLGSLCKFCSLRSLWDGIEMPTIKNAEDIAVIPVVLSRAKKITSIPQVLYYYIHSNASLSSNHKPEVSRNFITSFKYTEEHIDKTKYREELEFHGIKTILYGATLNALKAKMNSEDIRNMWNEFIENYPYWYSNKYIQYYPKSKRMFLLFIKNNQLNLLKLYSSVHSMLLRWFG